ncbi:MAG: hypothetical protein COA69_09355 [Robiginitomaculum sp.]|nr:MAG: hypothetical protein COA69_09355 [Robiginitomaculum sp.]
MTYAWKHLKCDRLRDTLALWDGTPYAPNQRARGQGADCRTLIAGILDDMFDMFVEIPFVPQNVGLHDRKRAISSIHAMLRGWHSADLVTDKSLEPGDILVTRSSPDQPGVPLPKNPGHVMIVTTNPFEILQSSQTLGAFRSDLEGVREILRTYRPRRKDLWIM